MTSADEWRAWLRREWAWYRPLAVFAAVIVLLAWLLIIAPGMWRSHLLSEACRDVGGRMVQSDLCVTQLDAYGHSQVDELRRESAEQP